VLSGYVIYAPATMIIKGAMAIIAHFFFKVMYKRAGKTSARIAGGIIAEIAMISGYFVFEGFLYGFMPSVVNIPANALQGAFGIIMGMILVKVFEKSKIF